MANKVLVSILAVHQLDGTIIPKQILWDDGRKFDVDRVTDMRQAASLKSGGQGMRYSCEIMGVPMFLFHDEVQWFVERRN